MEEPNGALKGMNGIGGGLKSSLSSRQLGPRKRARSSGSGFFGWCFSILARLFTWYSIITILFRCPPTLDACDESSPPVCKPYFKLKHAVAPHVEPYYDTYAAPYVELARPYYNTVDEKVITPGWAYATKYGAPRVQQVHAFTTAQWERNVRPQLEQYQTLAKARYDEKMAPHVERLSSNVSPYLEIARTNALQTYHQHVLPSFEFVRPYALQGYEAATTFTTETAVPSLVWAWNKTYVFLDGTVWPQLRIIYVENVEPQLVKIGQRLGRHNGKKPTQKVVVDSLTSTGTKASSTFTRPTSSSSSSAPPVASSEPSEDAQSPAEGGRVRTTADPVPPPEIDADEPEGDVRRIARETVAEDLKDWQERYAKAADEGAAEIEDRVEEITKRMIRRNARTTGKSLLEKLKSTSSTQLSILKHDISDIVKAVGNGTTTLEEAHELITSSVRRAGIAIKEKAQDVRTWRENYEMEMQESITKVAENHIKILEGIRDLALQKIGMKWAWMDGVTYKDWAKYHLLKSRFDEWQDELERHVVTHPGLEAAQLEGANIEDEAMKAAASAAKELGRLKQVAGWKLAAGDSSDEFDSDVTKQAAEDAEIAAAVQAEADAAAAAASATVADEPPAAEATAIDSSDNQSDSFDDIPVDASATATANDEPVAIDTDNFIATSEASVPDMDQDAQETVDMPDLASSTILPHMPEIVANEGVIFEDAEQEPMSDIDGRESVEEEEAEAEAGVPVEEEDVPVSSATSSIKSAMFGAAAQSVPSRQPVLDDEDVLGQDTLEKVTSVLVSVGKDIPMSLAAKAEEAFSGAVSRAEQQYSQALSAVSAQIHGTTEPIHEQMFASVTSAYSNVMASASSRYSQALSPKPEPTGYAIDWEGVKLIAAEKLNDGRAWAEDQYEKAKSAIGVAPTPSTPAGKASKMLENAKHNYYANLGVAHARYSEFIAAASAAVSSLTASPTPTDMAGSASSIASVANEKWDSVLSRVSVQVYGAPTPTPWYENFHVAEEGVASMTSAVSSYAAVASAEAAKQYSAASSIVSELLVGKEPTFSESVYSRLSAAYSANLALASSVASAAQATAAAAASDAAEAVKSVGEKVASAAAAATEAVKDSVGHEKDEL